MPIRTVFTWIFLKNCSFLHLDVSHMNVVYIAAKATKYVTNITIPRIILTSIRYRIENKLIFRKKKLFKFEHLHFHYEVYFPRCAYSYFHRFNNIHSKLI